MQNNPNDPTYTQYPPYPPPPARPPKKRRTWLWILLGAFAVLVLGCVGLVAIASIASQTGTTPQATTAVGNTPAIGNTPAATTAPATWKTIKTFTGNGSKKTPSFTVPDNWRIAWTCKPGSFGGIDYNVIITVENPDGSYADSGVNSTCKKGNTHDSTNVPGGGTFILDIISEGDWTAEVQTQG